MKRTENSPAFYYIKQLLCLLQVCRLKRVVELNGLELSPEEIHKELKSELADLRNNIVVPTLTIKSNHSVINLLNAYNRLLEAKLTSSDGYNPSIEKAVNEAPDLVKLSEEYKAKYEEEGATQEVRSEINSLINFSDGLFDDLYAYVENKESSLGFEQAIAWVNLLACVEFFFSVVEMGKQGFETEPDMEDNPWVE